MNFRNVILTGIPRSGTTLLCSLLNSYKNSLALVEPINPFEVPCNDKWEYLEFINNFFFKMRRNALCENMVLSHSKDGIIIENMLMKEDGNIGLRKRITKNEYVQVNKFLTNDFTLMIKQNAFFTALLDELVFFYPVYCVVRNPLAVLLSWNSVDLPVYRGHVPAAEMIDKDLKLKLSLTKDRLQRQMIILEWFYERYHSLIPENKIIKYETIIVDKKILRNITQEEPDERMKSIKIKPFRKHLYDTEMISILYDVISNEIDSALHFYSEKEISDYYRDLLI